LNQRIFKCIMKKVIQLKKKRKKKKRKLNRKRHLFISIFVILIVASFCYLGYTRTDSYQLSKIGYNKAEINEILKLNKNDIQTIKKNRYDKTLLSLMKEKEFKKENFHEYYSYKEEYHTTVKETIFIVNNKLNERKDYIKRLFIFK